MKRLIIRSVAREDLLDYYDYLSEQGAPLAGARFLQAVQQAFARIREMPGVGSPRDVDHPQLSGLRSLAVPGYEVVRFYYVETEDAVRIIRMLHGSRNVKSVLESERLEDA